MAVRGNFLSPTLAGKKWSPNYPLGAALLVLICWITRLTNLTLLPVFIDESFHIAWARTPLAGGLEHAGATARLGTVALFSLVLPFGQNPLWITRFVDVIAGTFACVGCYVLGKELFGRRVGLVAMTLYVLSPFAVFHERMALADPLVNAIGIYIAIVTIHLARRKRLRESILLGVLIAIAPVVKLSAMTAIAVPILGFLLLRRPRLEARAYSLALIPTFLMAIPVFGFFLLTGTGLREALPVGQSTRSLPAFLQNVASNLGTTVQWMASYLAFGLVLVIVGIMFTLLRRDRRGVWLGLVLVVNVAYVYLTPRIFPRYLLGGLAPAMILAAWAVVRGMPDLMQWTGEHFHFVTSRWRRQGDWIQSSAIAAVLLLAAIYDYPILSAMILNPVTSPIPAIDRWQYVEGWPAGYGYPEAAHYLQARAELAHGVNVYARGANGALWGTDQMLSVYLPASPLARHYDFDAQKPGVALGSSDAASQLPTFVVLNFPREGVTGKDYPPQSRLVLSYVKTGGTSRIEIWEIRP